MNVGELIGAENGESVLRSEASETITASGFCGDVVMASEMSEEDVGVPWMVVRLGFGVTDEGLRTRAVIVWLALRADSIMSLPVRPEPPMMRRCILISSLVLLGEVEIGGWETLLYEGRCVDRRVELKKPNY